MDLENLPESASFDFGDSLPSGRFPLLASFELARFFVGFPEPQPFEKAVVLDFFLQNFHGLFQVIVNDADLDLFQIASPFLSFGTIRSRRFLFGTLTQLFISR
jgi:hypothetical protein